MTITARIVADSTDQYLKHRLITWVLSYPRMVHAEFMTHRHLSRNASSSRAIPVLKQLERIERDPAMPVEWGANKPGMQADELLTPEQQQMALDAWRDGCRHAVEVSRRLAALNVHKQIANRVAESFSHITVVVTATEWANFFALRDHPMAQPEIRDLAALMASHYKQSVGQVLMPGDWHLPFITWDDEVQGLDLLTKIKCSAARCARVSYLNQDGTSPKVAEDLKLYDRLVGGKPMHASPVEHQATPFFQVLDVEPVTPTPFLFEPRSRWGYPFDTKWDDPAPWSANFKGFFQFRQSLKGQVATTLPWE